MQRISLFSGIGAFEEALGYVTDFEVVKWCENDPITARAYSLIHGISEENNLGDITDVDASSLPAVDLVTYGFPCQDLSIAGNRKGFVEDGQKTRSGLVYDALHIIQNTKPKVCIAENVKAFLSRRFSKEYNEIIGSLDGLGYNSYILCLNAKDYGIPQNRERVFIVSVRKDQAHLEGKPERTEMLPLSALIDTDVDPGRYGKSHSKALKETLTRHPRDGHTCIIDTYNRSVHYDCSNTITLPNHNNQFVYDGIGVRRLTGKECLRLMGYPDTVPDILYKAGYSENQLRKLAGNSIVVHVVYAIFIWLEDNRII